MWQKESIFLANECYKRAHRRSRPHENIKYNPVFHSHRYQSNSINNGAPSIEFINNGILTLRLFLCRQELTGRYYGSWIRGYNVPLLFHVEEQHVEHIPMDLRPPYVFLMAKGRTRGSNLFTLNRRRKSNSSWKKNCVTFWNSKKVSFTYVSTLVLFNNSHANFTKNIHIRNHSEISAFRGSTKRSNFVPRVMV